MPARLLLALLLSAPSLALAAAPCDWGDLRVEEDHAVAAAGQVLHRPGLELRLAAGALIPLAACGRSGAGLFFVGQGEATFTDPAVAAALGARWEGDGPWSVERLVAVAGDGSLSSLLSGDGVAMSGNQRGLLAEHQRGWSRALSPRQAPGDQIYAPVDELSGASVELTLVGLARRDDEGALHIGAARLELHDSPWEGRRWLLDGEPLAKAPTTPPRTWRLESTELSALVDRSPGRDDAPDRLDLIVRQRWVRAGAGSRWLVAHLEPGVSSGGVGGWERSVLGDVRVDGEPARYQQVADRLYVELPAGDAHELSAHLRGPMISDSPDSLRPLAAAWYPLDPLGRPHALSIAVATPPGWLGVASGAVLERFSGALRQRTTRAPTPLAGGVLAVGRWQEVGVVSPGPPRLRFITRRATPGEVRHLAKRLRGLMQRLESALGAFPGDELTVLERRALPPTPGLLGVESFGAGRSGNDAVLLRALATQWFVGVQPNWLREGLATATACRLAPAPRACRQELLTPLRRSWARSAAEAEPAPPLTLAGAAAGWRGPLVLHALDLVLDDRGGLPALLRDLPTPPTLASLATALGPAGAWITEETPLPRIEATWSPNGAGVRLRGAVSAPGPAGLWLGWQVTGPTSVLPLTLQGDFDLTLPLTTRPQLIALDPDRVFPGLVELSRAP